ncbi:MAG: hypothetical protein ISQ80_04610 [Candidatus Actinomarina sp.]|jgi:hypothetical protein|nr:hypothetical protein [Actinomycetota bacterium]MBL6833696.1 hypothetical protein [Candidatus Actinomarina sp.]MBL6837318.1 hypothetical protein [Candidatus Actinomarina sp.]MDB2326483.1 hypothetical protein [Candidatus Actinomarina sp.]MDB4823769.1 hypothetical protein [Acidimicrobiia bacterium]
MVNNIDEILELTKEISFQDTEEVDFAVTKFGEELINTKDLEFLWVARNATNIVKNKSSDIKTFSDYKMAEDIEGNGPVRLGDEVFIYNKSYNWKVQDLRNFVKWLVEKSSSNEELIDSLLAVMGQSFVPKLKGLDSVSNSKSLNTDMIRDTFLYKEWKDKPDLKTINTNTASAPSWAKDLKHKERRKI